MSSGADRPDRRPSIEPEDVTNERTHRPMSDFAEKDAMSTHDSSSPTDPTADPVAAPTGDPTADPTTEPVTEPGANPAATTEIPSTSTQALPTQPPFRVEPSSPVPDDVVVSGSELPHLPAPTPAPAPAPEPAPRPARATVHQGPRPATVMLGLLTVLVAAYLLLANLARVNLGFAVSGPAFLGAFGALLLLVGLAGVVAGRLRRH